MFFLPLLEVVGPAPLPPVVPSALTTCLPQWTWAEAPGRTWAAGSLLLSEIHVSWSPHGLDGPGYEDPPDSSGNPTRIPFRKLTERHSVSVVSKGKSRRQGSKQFLACLQTNGKYESQRGHLPHPAAGTGVGSACSVQPACRSRGPTTEAAAWKELQPRPSYLCYSDPPTWKGNKHRKSRKSLLSLEWAEPSRCPLVQSFLLHLPVDHSCILHQQTAAYPS